jgi:hypothetical protein
MTKKTEKGGKFRNVLCAGGFCVLGACVCWGL